MNYFVKIKLIFTILLITAIFINTDLKSQEVRIVAKVNNEIITNIDVENEYIYLTALNLSLKEIEKKKILDLAKNSLIKEKVKKFELLKYYELNKKNITVDNMINNIFQNLGLNSESEFIDYLNNLELDYENIYKKIEIETVWNQMIYSKYKDRVIINEDELKKEITDNKEETESFLLYEIIYKFENKNDINTIYNDIIKNIETEGFESTVIKFSISDSKNKSGLIGWVNKNNLSKKVKDEILAMNIGDISKPIILPTGILLLKLEDKKLEKVKIDIEKELENLIKYELNTQLNNYSTMLYNKIEKSLIINEY
tara:strand:+ start:1111 stop:2049 length:939 start_codon:yes stop_codon:yes gene_type:complete